VAAPELPDLPLEDPLEAPLEPAPLDLPVDPPVALLLPLEVDPLLPVLLLPVPLELPALVPPFNGVDPPHAAKAMAATSNEKRIETGMGTSGGNFG
jgi:hypothetical protein